MKDPRPGEPLIVFKDVRVGFDEGNVLDGISFQVSSGETKVLLGESGSGKTLIMKLAAGLMRADSGQIMVTGQEITGMTENELLDFRRRIGFVFQESALFDSLTVEENVAFRLREENVAEEEIDKRVRETLRFVEMEEAIEKYPAELSGGMRRRVSMARALVDRPPIVFYDSPLRSFRGACAAGFRWRALSSIDRPSCSMTRPPRASIRSRRKRSSL